MDPNKASFNKKATKEAKTEKYLFGFINEEKSHNKRLRESESDLTIFADRRNKKEQYNVSERCLFFHISLIFVSFRCLRNNEIFHFNTIVYIH